MSRPFFQTARTMGWSALLLISTARFVAAQTPAPPLPGQLQGKAPAQPAAPAPVPAPPPAAAAPNSPSKMQALETATQQPTANEAPRVAAPSEKITSSTSTSRQFIVHGKVFQTRSAMSTRCEEISQELRKVLHDKEPWVLPVVVLLNTGEEAAKSKGPPVATAITELTHGGFHLQVTLNDRPGLNAADLRKEIIRALLAERILRNHPKISTPKGRLLLPDWIMTGVLHALDYRASARPSALFATLFRSGKIYGIEEIIEASPVEMDGLSHTIYETSCCALVLALADQPDGPLHFNQFLNALASDPRSERELLNVAFPNFAASASSLNKWWALQLAALSKPGVAEPLSPAESLKAIEDAITLRYTALPADVPKDVKPRPFIVPPPLSVVAASEPEPEGAKPKRSLFRRLLFLGDPDAAAPKTQEAKKPSPLNPRNWFRSEKKPTEDRQDAKPTAPRTTVPNAKPAAPPGLVPVALPLEEYQHILKHPERVKLLDHNVASLRALELRVSVLFRPIVTGYLAAVRDLQQGKTKDLDKRLAALHEFTLIAHQKSSAVRDYLDWFEASGSTRLSGKFDDYLNLPTTIQKELPPRTDPVSKYLDAIDQEFSK